MFRPHLCPLLLHLFASFWMVPPPSLPLGLWPWPSNCLCISTLAPPPGHSPHRKERKPLKSELTPNQPCHSLACIFHISSLVWNKNKEYTALASWKFLKASKSQPMCRALSVPARYSQLLCLFCSVCVNSWRANWKCTLGHFSGSVSSNFFKKTYFYLYLSLCMHTLLFRCQLRAEESTGYPPSSSYRQRSWVSWMGAVSRGPL